MFPTGNPLHHPDNNRAKTADINAKPSNPKRVMLNLLSTEIIELVVRKLRESLPVQHFNAISSFQYEDPHMTRRKNHCHHC